MSEIANGDNREAEAIGAPLTASAFVFPAPLPQDRPPIAYSKRQVEPRKRGNLLCAAPLRYGWARLRQDDYGNDDRKG